jgi:vacuolar-type H+-ATPase subunit B/Vma2
MMKKGYHMMIIDRKVSSIESSFRIEGMPFNEECRRRVENVLAKNISAVDAIAELDRKYSVSAKNGGSEHNVLFNRKGT